MSLVQTITSTVYPYGRSGSILRVSVLLSPRLTWIDDVATSKDLVEWMDFRDGLWPSLVTGTGSGDAMEFQAVLRNDSGATTVEPVDVSDVTPRSLDSVSGRQELFALLFPGDTPVSPWEDQNLSTRKIRSYPLAGLSSALDRIQKDAPRGSRPMRDGVIGGKSGSGLLSSWAVSENDRTRALENISSQLAGRAKATTAPDLTKATGVKEAIVQVQEFLAPTRELTEADLDAGLTWKRPEFHELIAYVVSHPSLMRELGFLVDLEIDMSASPVPNGSVDIEVNVSYGDTYGGMIMHRNLHPSTASTLTSTSLQARRRLIESPDVPEMTPKSFANVKGWIAVTSEVESETLAMVTTAGDLSRARASEIETDDEPVGLPGRRSAGIAIVRPNGGVPFRESLNRSWTIQQSVSGETGLRLFAEDLVVGHRVDVRKAGGTWRSLHRRAGTLAPDPSVSPSMDDVALALDEGWVEAAPAEGIDPLEWRLSEAVARWTGWSLSLPRPGKHLGNDDTLTAGSSAFPAGVRGRLTYGQPPGGAGLPTLRFGQAYEIRLRCVDAAGRSPAVNTTVDAATSAYSAVLPITYRRHEPIPSPEIHATSELSWAESPEILVVRSEGAGAAPLAGERTRRMLAPPRGSQWLCEQHGMFDTSGVPDAERYDDIAARESADYAGESAIPYLADPLANGILLRGGPSSAVDFAGQDSEEFGGSWPALTALRLTVNATLTGSTGTDADGFVLDMPAGRSTRIRLSSSVLKARLALMDLWGRVGAPADEGDAAAGRWWQLTPDRQVTVVHATRRPVSAPRFAAADAWTVARPPGSTAATVDGFIRVDRPSTANVSVRGRLLSGVDEGPGTPAPSFESTDAGLIGIRDVPDPDPGMGEAKTALSLRVPMPDLRRRQLTMRAVATSRFAEFFREQRSVSIVGSGDMAIVGAVARPVVPGSVRITWTKSGATVTAAEGVNFTVDAEAGTLRRRGLVNPIPAPPAKVTLSWIAAPITLATSETAVEAERTREVTLRAAARPDAPAVASILPAFMWNSPKRPTPLQQTVTSRRDGGGLRLYLNRPWWTSGLEEDLAIVLRPPNGGPIHNDLTTRWGLDPATTVGGTLPAVWPTAAQFTNKSGTLSGVPIAEAAGATVDLAIYRIGRPGADGMPMGYDEDRGLWFADLSIDQGTAYRPFLRLALARYQAEAVSSIRLSPITILDIVQLEPDRIATVQVPVSLNQPTVLAEVTLEGPTYSSNEAGEGPGPARLILEESSPADVEGTGIGWQQVRDVQMEASFLGQGRGRWRGRITVPSNRVAGRYRLVVEQFENWRSDGRGISNPIVSRRLVHQDIIRL